MALIQIDKRAATPAEGQVLIDRSLGLVDPFGVPTLTISQQEIDAWVDKRRQDQLVPESISLREKLKKAMVAFRGYITENSLEVLDRSVNQAILARMTNPERYGFLIDKVDRLMKHDVYKDLNGVERIAARIMIIGNAELGLSLNEQSLNPIGSHQFNALRDTSVLDADIVGKMHAAMVFIDGKTLTDHLPVNDKYSKADQFFVIWHEYAHQLGANEPQADFIAATITRKAFASNAVLRGNADIRAIHTVLNFDANKNDKYGWGCVDANDYVHSLPDEKILGLTEGQIKNLVAQNFDPLTDAVGRVAEAVRRKRVPLHRLPLEEFRHDPEAMYISARFLHACVRSGLYNSPVNHHFMIAADLPNGKYPSFGNEPAI